MKVYQLTFSYLDPATAVATITAANEEEAVNIVKANLEPHVKDLVINSVEEMTEEKTALAEAETPSETIN